ncbi:MAG: hypothetical protein EBY37_05940, partial [Flavobacteriia bacterium]|nr:hypothetical protein [Flavobacteriia bacterium]
VHFIRLTRKELKEQVKAELLNRRGGFADLPESIEKIVDEECDVMYEYLKERLNPINYNANTRRVYYTSDYKANSSYFEVMLATKEGKGVRKVFNHFRTIKQNAQRQLIKKLNAQIKKLNNNRTNKVEEIRASEFLNVGHFAETAVSMQRKRAVENALFNFGQKGSKDVAPFIKALKDELKLNISKKPGSPIDVIGVTIESAFLNKKYGREVEAKLAPKINEALGRVLEKMEMENLSSSPTPVETRIDRTLNKFADVGKGKKNVRTNIKKKKINTKKVKAEKKKKVKAGKGKQFKDNTKAPKVVFDNKESRAGSTISLLALLNSKLSSTVQSNMGPPALENRTGRFAGSVRAIDVQKTKQGFLSVGYTYQKNPYQVFEKSSGSRFSSVDRDPRTLIDASIREIAAQMVTTKLYTRRL